MIREKVIEKYLYTKVREYGGRAIKLTSSNLRGLPDRLCLFPGGLVVFVEVKAPGRKPSPKQTNMINILRKLGFYAVWLDGRPKVNALISLLEIKGLIVRPKRSLVRNVPQKEDNE